MRDNPEFREFEDRVNRELVPKIEQSNIFVSIVPMSKEQVDVKFAIELGLAIMLNKPIIAVIKPGTEIPEKLSRVVERFVELDMNAPDMGERLTEVIQEELDKREI
jgi:hypothetical protein